MLKNKRKRISSGVSHHESPSGKIPAINNQKVFWLALFISLLTLAVYVPALHNGFVDWDDTQYVVANRDIRSLHWDFFRWALFDYKFNLWHPVTWISHAVDYALWGLNPLGHHLTSIILHATNTGVVVCLTVTLLGRAAAKSTTSGGGVFDQQTALIAAAVTGALFGLHPIHVESVAWVAERKDLLYSLFYLLSIIAYLSYVHDLETGLRQPWYLNRLYFLSLALFFLSLSSKPMAVTLPVVLLLLDWFPLQRMPSKQRLAALVLEKVPFIVLSVFVSILTIIAQRSAGGLKSLEDSPVAVRLLVALRSLITYLWNLIAPVNLLPFYPYPKDVSFSKPEYLTATLLFVLITTACLVFARKYKTWLAIWCFYVISVLPVLGFFQAGWQSMADRFMYLPSLGPFMLVGIAIAVIWKRAGDLQPFKLIIRGSIIIFVLALTQTMSLITTRQIGIWKSTLSLWDYNIKKAPAIYPEAYYLRAGAYRDIKQFDKSIEDFSKAITLDPKYAIAYIERGWVYLETKNYDLAIRDASRGISLKPDLFEALVIRGNAFLIKGDRNKALEEYSAAIAKKPEYAQAYIGRGFVYKILGDTDKAIADYSMALTLQPELAMIYTVRGDLYLDTGRAEMATSDYRKACERGDSTGCVKTLIPNKGGQTHF